MSTGSAAIDQQLTEELDTYCYMVEARCRPTSKHLDHYSGDRARSDYRKRMKAGTWTCEK